MAPDSNHSEQESTVQTQTILIVEDELSTLAIVESALAADDVTTIPVCTEAGANKHLRRPIDMFIIDLHLPDGSGLNLIRRIRRIAALHDTPIVVTTSSDRSEDITAAFMAGATDYLVKPVNITILQHKAKLLLRYQLQLSILQQEAKTDPLTQLFNRRAILEFAENTSQHSHSSGESFCTLIITIDGLENYCDINGYVASDKLLTEVSKVIRKQLVNSVDYAGRLEGDKFVVVLPSQRISKALRTAEKVATVLTGYFSNVKNNSTKLIRPSISIAEHTADSSSLADNVFAVPHRLLTTVQ